MTNRQATIFRNLSGRSLVLIVLAVLPVSAFAYIDPGSGSYFVQIAIASAVALAFKVKQILLLLKLYIGRIFGGGRE